jgi:hypothetical protein
MSTRRFTRSALKTARSVDARVRGEMTLAVGRVLVALCGCLIAALLAQSGMADGLPRTTLERSAPSPRGLDRVAFPPFPSVTTWPVSTGVVEPSVELQVAQISNGAQLGCQSGTAPTCVGSCPPFNVCQAIRIRELELCNCVGERAVCGTADPLCGGVCPEGQVCTGDVFGFGACKCDRPLPTPVTTTRPPIRPTTTTVATPLPPLCAASPYPECGGLCPQGESCVAHVGRNASGSCRCFSVSSVGGLCGGATTPQCDGTCPKGTTCMGDVGQCVCFDVFGATCGFFGPPECAGECPAATPICRDDGAGGCVCAP